MKTNETIIRKCTLDDLSYIEYLSKLENRSIGFIPKIAYECAIKGEKFGKRWSKTCNDSLFLLEENNDSVGFLFGSSKGKIYQICIQEDARLFQRGKLLLNEFISHSISNDFLCGCANDLESNNFWKAMNFILIGHRKGVSHKNTWEQTSKRDINIYIFQKDSLLMSKNKVNP
jgi:hypothetical protein